MPEQVIQCAAACTVTLQHTFNLPILNLTLQEGAALAGATLAVWSVGFVYREISRAISIRGASTNESENP